MTIKTVRIKAAMAVALGIISCGMYAATAAEGDVETQLAKTQAGVYCDNYDNKVGETFDCQHIDDEGEVVKTTTFLIGMGSNGFVVPVSINSVLETDKEPSEPVATVTDASDVADSVLIEPAAIVDESTVDVVVSGGTISIIQSPVSVDTEKKEEVNAPVPWTTTITNAYEASVEYMHETYESVVGTDPPVVDVPTETPAAVLPQEVDVPVVVPVMVPVIEAVLPTTLAEEVEDVVATPFHEEYGLALMQGEGSYVEFKHEIRWLAMNMVFEARNQQQIGMAMVADVTMNRLDINMRGDKTIYTVVTDPAEFTWYDDAVPDVLMMAELPLYEDALFEAEVLLLDYIAGDRVSITASSECKGGATHYHHVDVTPYWQTDMDSDCGIVGDHHFWAGK
tara:strand:+ start:3124 stop:4308 length:1185 start_codon:yes stop_codon:yes gene_type:complete